MAKKKKNHKAKAADEELLWVDPSRVRFQHSRIRPYFSGCGRSVQDTLDDLRQGKISPQDIPPIQVIIGPESPDGPWYFSLNNRRLWVFKRLREEGLLPNNQMAVRVRTPKSEAERARYSLENCALEAKLMREGAESSNKATKETASTMEESLEDDTTNAEKSKKKAPKHDRVEKARPTVESLTLVDDEDSSDDNSVGTPGRPNPFSVLG